MKILMGNLREIGELPKSFLRGGLMITGALLLGALLLSVSIGAPTFATYHIAKTAKAMQDMAPGILLIMVIVSAFSESMAKRKS